MSIYLPSLLDKFKDFVNGLKANWEEYEAHVADYETHKADYETHKADYETHKADYETHKAESASKHITESGSNENGSYIKFDDGTMICRRTVNPDRSIVNEEQSFSYPMSFIDVPSVSASHQWGANTAYQKSCGTMFLSGDTNRWRVAFTESTSVGSTLNMYLMAIGRWK